MADLVKRERRKEVFRVGSRVSVPSIFFDIDGSEFSALLPPDLHVKSLCNVHYTVQATLYCAGYNSALYCAGCNCNCTLQAATVYYAVELMHSVVEAVHYADWNCVLHRLKLCTAQA
jgi:hypothetical protein